jgi:hypothetical protein
VSIAPPPAASVTGVAAKAMLLFICRVPAFKVSVPPPSEAARSSARVLPPFTVVPPA